MEDGDAHVSSIHALGVPEGEPSRPGAALPLSQQLPRDDSPLSSSPTVLVRGHLASQAPKAPSSQGPSSGTLAPPQPRPARVKSGAAAVGALGRWPDHP